MAYRVVTLIALLLILIQPIALAQTDVNIEFYGTIQSANSTGLVMNGQIVDIRGAQVTTPLAAGLAVRVQAILLPDGSLAARQIDALPAGVIPGIVEISGTATDFALPVLIVNNQIIDLTDAEISGSIVIGQIVRVFAVAVTPGVWRARFVDASDNIPAPASTPEVDSPVTEALPPEVLMPAFTPEVSDDSGGDNSGSGSDDSGGDNSGSGASGMGDSGGGD
jgi:uncharacterized membrane protein YgcG